jgi:serine/threonine-protein kinase
MPEDRMENARSKTAGKAKGPSGEGIAKISPAPDTKTVQGTVTPEEYDPLWEQLGATRVTEGPSESSFSGVNLDSPANYTEISPSRILGKNVNTLGEYELIKKLGEGAMGAVYKAMQVSFQGEKLDKPRVVALKILFPHVASNPKLVKRLTREGEVMGQLDHPNIVQAFAVDEAEGYYYVAMEYVAGQSMQKWLTQLTMVPVGDAIRIAIDCAQALKYAHAQNMVHRDIKPDNILLTRTGMVKVADLGMVKTNDEEMSLTQTGHAVGTPWYMPLEQARNAKEIDGRSDIYALGCTLYAMLTGHPPFMGRTIVDVIQAKEVGTFPTARQSNAHVPERLDLIIAKMTAKLPKYRYQTCDEVIKDLEALGLANEHLSFVLPKTTKLTRRMEETPLPGRTSVVVAKSTGDAKLPADVSPTVDLDQWYVQMKMPDGKMVNRKYSTAQLQKMLTEGTMRPNARASHNPNDGFRSLGTYKEFQGAALNKLSKEAADKTSARTRGLYKKIEEDDRQRGEKEKVSNKEDTAVRANTRYWGGLALAILPIIVGVIGMIVLIWYFTR